MIPSDETQVHVLPFNMNAPNLSFNLSAGFRPEIGFIAEENAGSKASIDGNAGFFLNLPKLTTTVARLDSGTEKCEPPPTSGSAKVYQDLIHIEPSIELGGGYDWDVEVEPSNYSKHGGQYFPAFQTSLPTSCLKFDRKATGLTAPSDAVKSGATHGAAGKLADTWLLASLSVCAILLTNVIVL